MNTWTQPEKKLRNLPRWLSKKNSSITRLVAFYSRMYKDRYGIKPTISNWGKVGSLLKKLLKDNSEVMVACCMWIYFHDEDHYLQKNYYPIALLPKNFTKCQTRLKESLAEKYYNDVELKSWLKRNTGSILKKESGNVFKEKN